MKRKVVVLWRSRHAPSEFQQKELRRIFGNDVVCQLDGRPFSDEHEIAEQFRESGADELVIVAPFHIITGLLDLGIKPIISKMIYPDPKNRSYVRFCGFYRVVRADVEFKKLEGGNNDGGDEFEKRRNRVVAGRAHAPCRVHDVEPGEFHESLLRLLRSGLQR